MPIGIISDKELEKEISQLEEISPREKQEVIIKELERGRGKGNREVPDALRKVIGAAALEDRQEGLELADNFGISKSSVSAYKNGATSLSSYDEPNPSLAPFIQNTKNKIAQKARKKLLKSIQAITSEKLKESSARELSAVAKDLSTIAKDAEGLEETGPNVQFIMYTPPQKKIEQYEVIEVKEE